MTTNDQPINSVRWVHRDTLHPNDYNPNAVAPVELKLLKTSILEDGWTQPIVAHDDNTIVDGFHRWTVSGDVDIYRLTGGYVPVVFLRSKSAQDRRISTVRHNRARGTHAVLKMADIVENLLRAGVTAPEIQARLGMEREEVIRLALRKGIPKTQIIQSSDWSNSWTPK